MKITVEQLLQSGPSLLDRLPHKDILPFIQQYLKKRTISSVSYVAVNAVILGFIVNHFFTTSLTLDRSLSQLSLGVFLSFLLIPFHELIHGLAYKVLGAPRVSYTAQLKKFVFYAMADKFVVSANEFRFVALLPFLLINSAIVIVLILQSGTWTLSLLAMLLTHTGACSGDFGLLSYLDVHKGKRIVTYDDKEGSESFFYELTQ